MLLTRAPLRISLGGGGTDLPSYYRKHGGFLIAAAINKYVYIALQRTYVEQLIIRYSKYENVERVDDVHHPIIREALKMMGHDGRFLEITSMADIASGTGLGSSGSFGAALLKALHAWQQRLTPNEQIAAEACEIEINRLKEPVGKQDQYISALGGITCFEFNPDDTVKAYPLALSQDTQEELEDNLMLFFTGYSRSASAILKEQDQKSKEGDSSMFDNLHYTKELGLRSKKAFETGNLDEFGRIMNDHWQWKRKRSAGMSNAHIDELYETAMASGAVGGKLIGAGGGGFLLFYASDKPRLLRAMRAKGLSEVRFRFDFNGASIVFRD
jgi:D-glycero-alpha-D-manno-heptose-7-phosphate kinase